MTSIHKAMLDSSGKRVKQDVKSPWPLVTDSGHKRLIMFKV